MRSALFFVVVGAVTLAGCSTSPISAEQADPVPSSRLYGFQSRISAGDGVLTVTRDTGFTGSACNVRIAVNNRLVAEIGSGETASFYLKPDTYIVSLDPGAMCGGGLKEREVVISGKAQKRYRVSADLNGAGYDLTPTAF